MYVTFNEISKLTDSWHTSASSLSDSSMSIDSILNSDFSMLSPDEIRILIKKGEELVIKGNIALRSLKIWSRSV